MEESPALVWVCWDNLIPVPLSLIPETVLPLSGNSRKYLEILRLQVFSEHEGVVGSWHSADCVLRATVCVGSSALVSAGGADQTPLAGG